MIAVLLGITAATSSPLTQPAASSSSWTLVWSDEFDGPRLDASKWRAEDAAISNNKELQYYTPDAVTLQDGALVIRAERRSYKGREYTSGLIDSRGFFSMAFGRFECRAKLPKGQGMWPAIWMLPLDDRWPPEIDIMEYKGSEPRRIHTTHHWGPAWPQNRSTTGHSNGPDYSADFHVFSVEWTPDRLDWLIDGEVKFTSTANIPQDPCYLIINLAVGGHWSGNPDESTLFPQEMRVDWVRAYQKVDASSASLLIDAQHGEALPEPRRWSFKPGEKASVRAEPDIGYMFKGWSGDVRGTENPIEFELQKNTRVVAEFAPLPNAPMLLSRNRPVRASSSEGEGMEPERAVDGSLWSRWASKHTDPLWLEVDLGEPRTIEAVRLAWTDVLRGSYSIEVSDDRAHWTKAAPPRKGATRREKITGLDARGRYVRLSITDLDRTGGCSLFSFEVYGK